jgi:hypothetical protein
MPIVTYTTYIIGSLVRVQAAFTVVSGGAAYDPTAVGVKVRNPAGVETTYTYAGGEVKKSGTGVYYYDVDANVAGHWSYYWYGTGTGQAAENGGFEVENMYI